MDKSQPEDSGPNKKAEGTAKKSKGAEANLCPAYDVDKYAKDPEYKENTDEEFKKIVGAIDETINAKAPYDEVIKLRADVGDVSKLLVDYSNSKGDFSMVMDTAAKLGPIEKSVSNEPKASGLGGRIDKFQNRLEEVYVRIALNDCKIRVLLAQYEQIDTYFYSILSTMNKVDDPHTERSASSHAFETKKFLKSIGMEAYRPLGNNAPSTENTLTLFETLDEIKSENKLYRHILKENGKKYE